MSRWADLHIHTDYSDSSASVEEVLKESQHQALSCISITDHDTIEGVFPTIEMAKDHQIEILPGVELSTELNGKDIDILGYGFDIHNEVFLKKLSEIQDERQVRMKMMIQKLDSLGLKGIEFEEVASLTKSRSVGRPHLAEVLVRKGFVPNLRVAFEKYLGEGAAAYISTCFKMTPYEAIDLVNQAGGITVLAHPMLTCVDNLIASFAKAGMKGLEAYYPNVSPTVIEAYTKLAKKYGMIATGGSDAHGVVKKHTSIGRMKIPYSVVEQIKDLCTPK